MPMSTITYLLLDSQVFIETTKNVPGLVADDGDME